MNGLIFTLGAFLIALMILITVHEFGHFWVARKLGVKVLRFSIGFGKSIIQYVGKDGTEYRLALFPLGGYVKMLDEREGNVNDSEKHLAFNRQSLAKRSAIVVAGPLFNILFAIVAYWGMYVLGVQSLVAVVGDVAPGSIAAQAGLQSQQVITKVGEQATDNWSQVRLALLRSAGDKAPLSIQTRGLHNALVQQHQLDIANWQLNPKQPRPLKSLGLSIYYPSIPPVIGRVMPGMPGERAGLKVGDRLLKVNDIAMKDWNHFVKYIRVRPKLDHQILVERGNQRLTLAVKPELKTAEDGKTIAFVGIQPKPMPWPKELISIQKYSWLGAIGPALTMLYQMVVLTFVMLGKLVLGKLSLQSLSGPVGIAIGAGQSASVGLNYYLNFLGLVSVSLAVLNILPLPVLDGGHLVYFMIEAVRGKPLSEKAEQFGLKIGVSLLLVLMMVALYNDVTRLIG